MQRRKMRQKQQVNFEKAAEKLLSNIVKETLIKQIESGGGKTKFFGTGEENTQKESEEEIEMEEKRSGEGKKGSDKEDHAHITSVLIDKYRSLLEANDIDIEIFQTLDIDEQYEVVEQLERD